MKKLLLAFVITGLSIASAKTYTVTLYQPSMIGETELKPGDYKLDLQDNKAVIRAGKMKREAEVKVENGDQKYGSTTVRFNNSGGKYRIQEIRLGGTSMKVIFNN